MIENIPDTEQWLLSGNCDKCRRSKYCHTPCTVAKRSFRTEIALSVFSGMLKKMKGA